MTSLPTLNSNVIGCFQYLSSNLQDFSSVTLDSEKKKAQLPKQQHLLLKC